MKHIFRILREAVDAADLIAVACFSLFVRFWADTSGGVITGILGGIPDAFGNTPEFVPLGKWLFLFAFYFLMAGRKLSSGRKTLTFTLYRYRSFRAWWARCFLTLHMRNFLMLLISCGIWAAMEAAAGIRGEKNLWIILTFFLHLSAWISVIALCDLISEKKLAPCVLIVAEGMLYIFSVNFRMPYLACGMYVRCVYSGAAFAMAAALETGITAACLLLAPRLWDRGILERKMI